MVVHTSICLRLRLRLRLHLRRSCEPAFTGQAWLEWLSLGSSSSNDGNGKGTLEIKHLESDDFYVVILFFFSYRKWMVEARWSMKDLVSCVHIVAKLKAFNFEVSRCHLPDYVKELN